MVSRYGPFLLSFALLTGCVSAPDGPRKAPVKQSGLTLPDNALMKACVGDLNKLGAGFSVLADHYSGNCSAINSVKLTDIGIPITNLAATQCSLARDFTVWARVAVQLAAREVFGKSVTKVETMGSYSCRTVRGVVSNRLSEHAFANAIDVSGFVLSDGRRITVEMGWNTDPDDSRFLHLIRDSACKRFKTVLSPDYNAAHYNHLHFDMGRGPYCR
jgi:hypothetical protein